MQSIADMDHVAVRIRRLIAESTNRSQDDVPLDARLDATQLGIDSLGLVKLAVRLEETFEIAMPDLAAEPGRGTPQTVGDVVALVGREMARQREVRS
jgi:acyl carrier protein